MRITTVYCECGKFTENIFKIMYMKYVCNVCNTCVTLLSVFIIFGHYCYRSGENNAVFEFIWNFTSYARAEQWANGFRHGRKTACCHGPRWPEAVCLDYSWPETTGFAHEPFPAGAMPKRPRKWLGRIFSGVSFCKCFNWTAALRKRVNKLSCRNAASMKTQTGLRRPRRPCG